MTLLRYLVQTPLPHRPDVGPGWTDLWLRDDTDDDAVLREIWVQDVYHLRGIDLKGGLVIDLGAHIGIFSAFCCTMRAARVIAVEPNLENNELAVRNLARWRHVEVHHAAASPRPGVPMVGSGSGGHASPQTHGEYTVPGISLTSLDLIGNRVTLLKCDIEGGEYDLFNETPDEWLDNVDEIVMEWHGPVEAPWVQFGEDRNVGVLVEKLQRTHSCQIIGHPDRGGYIYGHHA